MIHEDKKETSIQLETATELDPFAVDVGTQAEANVLLNKVFDPFGLNEKVYIDIDTHDFSEMLLAVPRERIIKITILVAAAKGLWKLKAGATTIVPVAKSVAINFVNNARNFVNAQTTIAGKTIRFNRADMIHVLQRHHPNFWAGVQNGGRAGANGPGLFARSATPNAIRDLAFHVLGQHSGRIRAISGAVTGTFDARVGSHVFRVVVSNGRIVTVFPPR